MSPRTGRPISDNAKRHLLQVRLDEETLKKLDDCVESRDTNRSEVIRHGVELVKREEDTKK